MREGGTRLSLSMNRGEQNLTQRPQGREGMNQIDYE
jgi:hypothetical protein